MKGIDRTRLLQRVGLTPQSGAVRVGAVVTVSFAGCAVGGPLGYFLAFGLNHYEPGATEWQSLIFTVIAGIVFVPLLLTIRYVGATRIAASWFLVAAAAAYLWTSTTFDYDVRQLADTAEFGVFAVDLPKYEGAVTRAQLTIDDSGAWLDLESAPDSSPLVLVVAPMRPEHGCSEYGTFGGSLVYACVAPTGVRFDNAVSYSWTGAALEAGGVSIMTNDAEEIGVLPVSTVPVDVTFETYSSFDDERIFHRPLLGVAAVDQYAVTFIANAQTPVDDRWTAVVEYRFPRGTALLSIARDLSLILLGGAVSLFLIPQASARGQQPVRAMSGPPATIAETSPRTSEQRARQPSQPPRSPKVRWASMLTVAVVLVALRRRRKSGG